MDLIQGFIQRSWTTSTGSRVHPSATSFKRAALRSTEPFGWRWRIQPFIPTALNFSPVRTLDTEASVKHDEIVQSRPAHLVFSYGIWGFAKRTIYQQVSQESYTIQEPDKPGFCAYDFGEDAGFARRDALGVADGVGGWRGKGPNAVPAAFAISLMYYLCHLVKKYGADPFAGNQIEGAPPTPPPSSPPSGSPAKMQNPARYLLSKAVEGMLKITSDMGMVGSTTAVAAILQKDSSLSIVNVGDSALVVLRNDQVLLKTTEQTFGFNWPFQLGTNCRNTVEDAMFYEIPEMKKGDVVILGSDGLFDNLFPGEINNLVKQLGKNASAASIAKKVALEAKCTSEDRTRRTPFQVAAEEAGRNHPGGKRDDITVVVGKVIEDGSL